MEINYLRGAFIAYEPGGYPDRKRVIPFRFNPESLSRQLSIEQGAGGGTGSQAAPQWRQPRANRAPTRRPARSRKHSACKSVST